MEHNRRTGKCETSDVVEVKATVHEEGNLLTMKYGICPERYGGMSFCARYKGLVLGLVNPYKSANVERARQQRPMPLEVQMM